MVKKIGVPINFICKQCESSLKRKILGKIMYVNTSASVVLFQIEYLCKCFPSLSQHLCSSFTNNWRCADGQLFNSYFCLKELWSSCTCFTVNNFRACNSRVITNQLRKCHLLKAFCTMTRNIDDIIDLLSPSADSWAVYCFIYLKKY